MTLSEQMDAILHLFVQKFEAINGKFPDGHAHLNDLGIGVYVSGKSLEATKDYYQIKALNITVNINGTIETGIQGIDNAQPLLIGKFLSAVQTCLEQGKNLDELYKKDDFFGQYDLRKEVVEKQIVKEVENPMHKAKAQILDKLLFEREAVFREPQY